MTSLGIDNYPGFIIACIILNITPGVDTVYILTRSISQGKKAGLVSVAGIMTGCVVHVLCAALGLSLILTRSALVFNGIKWAGALYLIFMGIQTLRKKTAEFETVPRVEGLNGNLGKIYKQGVLTNVLNPKVALFFLSFLPLFIHEGAASRLGPLPFLILGTTFLFTGTLWCLFLNWGAAQMSRRFREDSRISHLLHKVSGMVYICFGLKLALDSK